MCYNLLTYLVDSHNSIFPRTLGERVQGDHTLHLPALHSRPPGLHGQTPGHAEHEALHRLHPQGLGHAARGWPGEGHGLGLQVHHREAHQGPQRGPDPGPEGAPGGGPVRGLPATGPITWTTSFYRLYVIIYPNLAAYYHRSTINKTL